jgi:hypothetical protein
VTAEETPEQRAAFDALISEIVPTRAVGETADLYRAFARALSPITEMWKTLLAQHTESEDGRYCVHPQCRLGGYGSLTTPHPCSVRVLALMAQGMYEGMGR